MRNTIQAVILSCVVAVSAVAGGWIADSIFGHHGPSEEAQRIDDELTAQLERERQATAPTIVHFDLSDIELPEHAK